MIHYCKKIPLLSTASSSLSFWCLVQANIQLIVLFTKNHWYEINLDYNGPVVGCFSPDSGWDKFKTWKRNCKPRARFIHFFFSWCCRAICLYAAHPPAYATERFKNSAVIPVE